MQMFQELSAKLKTVKSTNDISEELSEELMTAAIEAYMVVVVKQGQLEPEEAFLVVRGLALQHLDILRDSLMFDMGEFDDDEEEEENDPKLFKL